MIYVIWFVYSEVFVREFFLEIDLVVVGFFILKFRNLIYWVWLEKVSKYNFVVEYKNFTMYCINNKLEKFCVF